MVAPVLVIGATSLGASKNPGWRMRSEGPPPPHEGLQLNTCRNTMCANFGVEPTVRGQDGRRARDHYRVIGSDPIKALKCMRCGQRVRIKSNRAAAEEHLRHIDYLSLPEEPVCPRATCVDRAPLVYRHGSTPDGSVRFRCRRCGKTFSAPITPTWKQKASDKNALLFRLLINRSPMRRILEVADVSASTLYRKIEFIHQQCQRFAARFERRLPEMALPAVQLETDLQDHLVNWGRDVDRLSVILRAVATTESNSQYVLAVSINFDGSIDPGEAERNARECGDFDRMTYERQCARIWVASDYMACSRASAAKLGAHTQQHRTRTADYGDDEDPFTEKWEVKQPSRGVQVHQAYLLMGHFQTVKYLIGGATSATACLDPDAGLRQAAIAVFRSWIMQSKFEAFELNIDKSLTIDQKKLVVMRAKAALNLARKRMGDHHRDDAARALIKHQVHEMANQPPNQRWIEHPLPSLAEPKLRVLHLTPRSTSNLDQVASMVFDATLRNTDRFFMITRRRLSLLERPIKTPSSAQRSCYIYAPYNPNVPCRLLDALRVAHNYHWVGKDNRTPAMRLGLTDRPFSLEDILAEPRDVPGLIRR